jgi:hypothetical protein
MWFFTRLLSKFIIRAYGVNFHAPFTHPQTKPPAFNTALTPPNPLQKVKKIELSGSLGSIQLGMSAYAMPNRGAQNDMCRLDNVLVVRNSTDNSYFKLASNRTE